eukprot:13398073-Alexandrium_andersonii.AAC.1
MSGASWRQCYYDVCNKGVFVVLGRFIVWKTGFSLPNIVSPPVRLVDFTGDHSWRERATQRGEGPASLGLCPAVCRTLRFMSVC